MCGIAGFVQTHPFIREDAVPLLWEALALRGPNDQGYLSLDNNQFICQRHWNPAHAVSPLLLVHRRLSILDLSPSGWQPMCSPDGNYALVFNGEIYNYRELRALLEQEGFTFKSQSDTEVLLYALMAWGADALKKCIGMFALAFVNKSARTLLLARDFFGIKPLYYGTKTGVLAFCSTISGVLSSLKMPAVAHRSKALEYLTYGGTDEGSQTLFAGVHQLPPAHYAKISLDAPEKLEITRYWRAEVQQTIDCSFDEAKAEVRRIFLESIGLHLRSDVPLGTALSGGLDSSSIVMGMRAHLGPSAQLHAFSYIADEERIKEERWVDLLAKQAQITPDKIFATESDLANQIALLARSIEEPCTSASVFAQRLVFERAKMRGITVMLDGQGADEIFGGYDHYLAIQLWSLIRAAKFASAIRFALAIKRSGRMRATKIATRMLHTALPSALKKAALPLLQNFLYPSWLKSPIASPPVAHLDLPSAGSALRYELRRTLEETVLPHLLRYEDRNSMAYSIESRVPFLIPELVQFAYSLPDHFLISPQARSKYVLREAMRGLVPNQILDRTDKIGFATPQINWLNSSSLCWEQLIDLDILSHLPFFDRNKIQVQIAGIRSGKMRVDSTWWRLISFTQWAKSFGVTQCDSST